MRNLFARFVGLSTLGLVSACGGTSSGTASCGNASACGGDVVGTWGVTSSCITVDAASMMGSTSCPGETQSSSGLKITGTISYAVDKTYNSNFSISGNVLVNVPASCLTQQGVTITCSQLQQGIASTSSSATCSGSGGGCACTVALKPQVTMERGTYSTASGVLSQTPAGGTPAENNYCVAGTTLTVSPTSGTSMMSSGLTGTVVLAKQ